MRPTQFHNLGGEQVVRVARRYLSGMFHSQALLWYCSSVLHVLICIILKQILLFLKSLLQVTQIGCIVVFQATRSSRPFIGLLSNSCWSLNWVLLASQICILGLSKANTKSPNVCTELKYEGLANLMLVVTQLKSQGIDLEGIICPCSRKQERHTLHVLE